MTQEKNSENIQLPSYNLFQEGLSLMKTELSPAECQGIALGLLAWDHQSRAAQEWASLIEQEFNLDDKLVPEGETEIYQWLNGLFKLADKGLRDHNFGLKLYLLPDEAPLYARAEAVSQWCRGFMYGLGLMGFDNRMLSNPLINEALQDISQIMNIEINPNEVSDSSEKEYFELVEYLRMASVLIYSEIAGIDQGAGKSAYGLH